MPEYEELQDIEEEDELEKMKKRIKRQKERSSEVIRERLKKDPLYKKGRLGCYSKLKLDFTNHINYLYSENKPGKFFLFLFFCYMISFPFCAYMFFHAQYYFILVPSMVLFAYHCVMSMIKLKIYPAIFFLVQFGVQLSIVFWPNKFVLYGFASCIFTTIHLFVNAKLTNLVFYLRVCIIFGVSYFGIAIKQTDKFSVENYYFLYFGILLALVNIVINKLTVLQLLCIWIPQTIKLFFRTTCCEPSIKFEFKGVYLHNNKFILKGNFKLF